jgi:tetratricopeptide (TPR) repeat protein
MSATHFTREGRATDRPALEADSVSLPWRVSIIATTVASLLLKLLLAAKTYGTNDVYRFEEFMAASRYFGAFIYRATPDFNHPPSMIHLLLLIGWLSNVTSLPFSFWLRVPGILADAASVWVLWKILGPRLQERSIRWALLMFAAAPPFFLVAGFHGNTDTIMIFFLLLSVYVNERSMQTWLAGVMFGLSVCFKITPVVTAPVMYFYMRDLRKRIAFFSAAGGVLLIAWSPYIFQDTWFMVRQIFGYHSIYGHWGLSYLSARLLDRMPAWGWPNDGFRLGGAYALLGGTTYLAWWMNRQDTRARLYSQVGIVFFLLLSLTNAFGVQYLAWLVPWVVGLGAMPTAIFFTASGVFLFLVYNYWSQGVPWYMADSYRMGDFQGHLDYFQIMCWLSILVILIVAWGQIRTSAAGPRLSPSRSSTRTPYFVAVFVAFIFLIYPAFRQARRDNLSIPWPTRQQRASNARAAQYLDLSSELYRMGRYQDAIAAAQQAVALRPDFVAAYGNLSTAYEALHMWDEALRNAQQAIQLQPDFPMSKDNFARILEEKRESGGSQPSR